MALVRRCAEPRPAGDQVKAAILRSSRRLGLPFNRTKDIWYGDARRIDATGMDRLAGDWQGVPFRVRAPHLFALGIYNSMGLIL